MNGLLDKVINIFIRVGSVFTGVLLAAWIYHSLLEFISDKFWNRSNIPWGVSTLIFYLTLPVFVFQQYPMGYFYWLMEVSTHCKRLNSNYLSKT